jgi:hypothetical protein
MKDMRRHPRVDEKLKFRLGNQSHDWIENIVNIGAGGIRFKTDRNYALDDVVGLQIVFNHGGMSNVFVRVSGRVVRISMVEGTYEVTLEFIGLDKETTTILDQISEKGCATILTF